MTTSGSSGGLELAPLGSGLAAGAWKELGVSGWATSHADWLVVGDDEEPPAAGARSCAIVRRASAHRAR